MPVPILCHVCHGGRHQPENPGTYRCRSCGSPATESTFPVQSDERLVVLAGVLQVLAVPNGHQVIAPDRRCYAPHLGASLSLALRVNRTHPVFRQAEGIGTAEDLLSVLDADERDPWVLSPTQLGGPHPGHGRPQRTAAVGGPAVPGLRLGDPGRAYPQPAPARHVRPRLPDRRHRARPLRLAAPAPASPARRICP
ncbi:hypothetical protein QBB34_48000 [Streptomyces stelliscabiei]|uniref:hypothetical protein n=1 Tax=Streptomyces stelliscabiei TaxID=146820 RepID=UPI002FF2364D